MGVSLFEHVSTHFTKGFPPSRELSPEQVVNFRFPNPSRSNPTLSTQNLSVFRGESGIRTHGGLFTLNGFQDRRLKPLSHLSIVIACDPMILDGKDSVNPPNITLDFSLKTGYTGNTYRMHTIAHPDNGAGGQWHDFEEGELAVDVLDNGNDIVIISTVSGIHPDRVEIYIDGDTVTIRGHREHPYAESDQATYYHMECYWGDFSRTIILPVHVKRTGAAARYDRGVLTITIPKEQTGFTIPIEVVDE